MDVCVLYAIVHKDIQIKYKNDEIIIDIVPSIFKYLYIGYTNDFERRMKEHLIKSLDTSYQSSQKLYRRLRSHGWNSYNKIIIKSGLTREKAKKYEIKTIEKYNSFELGLNSTPGGDGSGTGINHYRAQPVNIYNNTTKEITSFMWMGDAADFLGIKSKFVSQSSKFKITI
jgi:predicted GIY-YIG superfamily endonuclease